MNNDPGILESVVADVEVASHAQRELESTVEKLQSLKSCVQPIANPIDLRRIRVFVEAAHEFMKNRFCVF
jgi:hypothetical protein